MKEEDLIEIKIQGMSCVSCEKTIGNALKKAPYVDDFRLDFISSEVTYYSFHPMTKNDKRE